MVVPICHLPSPAVHGLSAASQSGQESKLSAAIANERLSRNAKGQVELQLNSPYCDGTPHIVMAPQEFMQRLAALGPRPRLHLIRFHGVLAPNVKLRAAAVPAAVQETRRTRRRARARHIGAHELGALLKRVFDIDIEHCPNCGGRLKSIAAIEAPAVITGILTHPGLAARAPPVAPRRRPEFLPAA